MTVVESNFALVALLLLAFAAGVLLARRRMRCPACGWSRQRRAPAAFEYGGVVGVRQTSQRMWAVSVLGREPILLGSRAAALELAIRELVDARYPQAGKANNPKKERLG